MIDDSAFNAKFHTVIDIFQSWMPRDFDYTQARILDFGCEYGVMSLALALRLKPKQVVGVDINDLHKQLLNLVGHKVSLDRLPENLEFHQVTAVEQLSRRFQFDVIFSWSTFEHVNQPDLGNVIRELYDCLSPTGWIFLQIAPLYYSAFGSHLEPLLDVPWAHLVMQNNLLKHKILTAPQRPPYDREDAQNYEAIKAGIWSCYETLNKITAEELIEAFESNGFETVRHLKTERAQEPPPNLLRVFSRDILKTEQIVALFRKKQATSTRPSIWRRPFFKGAHK